MLNHEKKHKMIEEINRKIKGTKNSQSFFYVLDNLENMKKGYVSTEEILKTAEIIRKGGNI